MSVQMTEEGLSVNHSLPRSPYEALLNQACATAQDYLASVRDRHVGVTQQALDGMLALGGAMPVAGEPADLVLKILYEAGSPATTATMGGRFFGGVIGGSLPITVAAHWLADAWDQNACLSDISPISAYLEDVVLSWLLDLFDLPRSAGGALVTGTQMADVTALAAARTSLLAGVGWDVERDGLFGAPPISVVVGEEVHATMLKALALLGFGRERVIRVPADSQGRMLASHIPNASRQSSTWKRSFARSSHGTSGLPRQRRSFRHSALQPVKTSFFRRTCSSNTCFPCAISPQRQWKPIVVTSGFRGHPASRCSPGRAIFPLPENRRM